jgi:hypothetical protein
VIDGPCACRVLAPVDPQQAQVLDGIRHPALKAVAFDRGRVRQRTVCASDQRRADHVTPHRLVKECRRSGRSWLGRPAALREDSNRRLHRDPKRRRLTSPGPAILRGACCVPTSPLTAPTWSPQPDGNVPSLSRQAQMTSGTTLRSVGLNRPSRGGAWRRTRLPGRDARGRAWRGSS